MSFSPRRCAALALMQVRELSRDYGTLFLNFVFPLMFVLGLLFSNMADPTFKFKVGVADARGDASAREFVEYLTASPSIDAVAFAPDALEGALREAEVHAGVVLGADPATVELVVGPRYREFSELMLDAVRDRMAGQREARTPVFDYRIRTPEGTVRSEITYVFPGILALALLQLGLFATATPLLHARERGTLRYLLLTPITVPELLASQLAVRCGIALLQVALLLAAGMTLLELDLGQWLAVLGVSVLGIVMLVSIGYAIAGVAPGLQAGIAIVMMTNFAMLFGGTVFWDPSTSDLLYYAAMAVPLSYLADLFRQVITGDAGLWPFWVDAVAVSAWSAVALAVALRTFRFDTNAGAARPASA